MIVDWRDRVLAQIINDAAGMVDCLASLVRLPSMGGSAEENDIQVELGRRLDGVGLEVDRWEIPLRDLLAHPDFPGSEVSRDEAWGLVGRLPGRGEGRTLMLQGHVDVVPPGNRANWGSGDPFGGRVSGGQLFGRGACDMKAGLVAALFAVTALRRCGVPLRGDVLFASVQAEEDGGLGAVALLHRGYRAEACVIPEPTNLDLVPAAGGALTFRLHVHGHATHASRHMSGVSAVGKLWPLWRALNELERRRNLEVDPLMSRWPIAYPLSLGTVHAGDWASSIPDLLVAEGRIGVALDEPVEATRAALEEAVAQACADDPWLGAHPVQVQWWGGQFGSGRLPADSELLEQVRGAHADAGGEEPGVYGVPYGSDLRLMNGLGAIPTLHYGPGDAELAHGPDERVPLHQVLTAAQTLALLALEVCGVGG